MLRLTGRLADGWLPSLGGKFLAPGDALRMQGVVDEAARAAGRDPGEIERAANVMALAAEPRALADELARIASELRFTTLLVSVPGDDPIGFVRRLGEDVAPRVRELLG
jgi:alkanesulfonate monooxygenase SsuD/methylene tetrahydromethanopterin reductase-like flavin-dependent oxidoreductase (luciferase family)